jgi:hypothetical protein
MNKPDACEPKHDELIETIDARIAACRGDVVRELHALNSKISAAFPSDDTGHVDFIGHRRAHESMIKAAHAQEDFWRELRLDIAKKGAWGMLIIIVGLVLVGVSAKFGIGAPR